MVRYQAAELTYSECGATGADLPDSYRHLRRRVLPYLPERRAVWSALALTRIFPFAENVTDKTAFVWPVRGLANDCGSAGSAMFQTRTGLPSSAISSVISGDSPENTDSTTQSTTAHNRS